MMLKLFILFSFSLCFAQTDKKTDLPLDTDLGGVKTPYTEQIIRLLKHWPPTGISEKSFSEPLKIQCFSTPDNPLYIGMLQMMWVQAPLQRVEAVIEDAGQFKDFFPGFLESKLTPIAANRWQVYFEQPPPVIFTKKIIYSMLYMAVQPTAKMKIYRYQEKDGNYLKSSDGTIVLEEMGPNLTRYIEYDFWDADWGLAKTLGLGGKIWHENVRGSALTDIALKLKAENPTWKDIKIREETREQVKQLPIDKWLVEKTAWPLIPD